MTDARRPARRIALAVIAAVVLIAAGLFAAERLRPSEGPADVAARYWHLLAQGHAQEALALTNLATPPNPLLLTDAVYEKADRGIAHIRTGAVHEQGARASVTVDFTQHGTKARSSLELARTAGGPLHPGEWRITNARLATVKVTIAAGGHARSLAVEGRSLPLPGGDGSLSIPALPGTYRFSLASDTKLLSPGSASVAVGSDPTRVYPVTLTLAPSAEFGSQAVERATALLNGCFAQPSLSPDCSLAQGIRNLFNLTAEDSVTYQLSRAPRLAFDAASRQVRSTADGTVTATPTDALWGTFQNHAEFSVTLDATLTPNGSVTVTPHQGGVSLVAYTQ
jgi:hypothetical protein